MKWPTSLKIGAHDIEVVYSDSHLAEPDFLGETRYHEGKIYIREDLPDSLKFSTLIHETMHVMTSSLDHALLDSIAEQISQVLWDNGFLDEE